MLQMLLRCEDRFDQNSFRGLNGVSLLLIRADRIIAGVPRSSIIGPTPFKIVFSQIYRPYLPPQYGGLQKTVCFQNHKFIYN